MEPSRREGEPEGPLKAGDDMQRNQWADQGQALRFQSDAERGVRCMGASRLGSVEVEVVECNSSAPEAGLAPFPTPQSSSEMFELEARLATAQERIAQLEGESRQGFQSSIVAADRAEVV